MIVLGIESSCDETAVAIIKEKEVLSHKLFSQIKVHKGFGGVVPEIAAREHLEIIDILIKEAIKESGINLENIDGFCATTGPGLAGGLIIGSLAAKTLAFATEKPFIEVNHLQAHALVPLMKDDISYPFLLLLVSGGHTQFVAVLGVNKYKILGSTIDDAIGEAFDKSARLMGLDYPGGKEIEKLALKGDKSRFILPRPLIHKKGCDFSFSGLKTAVANVVRNNEITDNLKQDLSASLLDTIVDILIKKSSYAIEEFVKDYGRLESFVVSGGVAANLVIRDNLNEFLKEKNINLYFPSIEICTDNAIMIAWVGLLKLKEGKISKLNTPIKVRWSLEDI